MARIGALAFALLAPAAGCADMRRSLGEDCLKNQDCQSDVCSSLKCAAPPPLLDASAAIPPPAPTSDGGDAGDAGNAGNAGDAGDAEMRADGGLDDGGDAAVSSDANGARSDGAADAGAAVDGATIDGASALDSGATDAAGEN